MIDIKQALSHAINLLAPTTTSAQLDAEVLLAHTLGTSRTFLYTHPEKKLSPIQKEAYQNLIDQRSEGLPIAYLTGSREFWSLPLRISEDTLIPRPETELLVELSLNLLKNISNALILDAGTGSGAIALALASERPDWQVHACDISQAAVEVARHNAAHLGLSNVHIHNSNWFASVPTKQFHAIISNPPYIAKTDPHLTQGDVRFEPKQALVSGENGLEALTHIVKYGYDRLFAGGLLLLEHGFEQKQAVTSLLSQSDYQQVQCWQDWQKHDRVSGGWRL